METLDRCFENVCELDLIFHVDKVQTSSPSPPLTSLVHKMTFVCVGAQYSPGDMHGWDGPRD